MVRRTLSPGVSGLAGFLATRSSPWVVPLDVIAASGLVALATGVARGGALSRLGFADLARRVAAPAMAAVFAVPFLAGAARFLRQRHRPPGDWGEGRAARRRSIVAGLLIAAPLVAVLMALLSSADAVFASVLRRPQELLDLPELTGHVLLVAVGAWLAGALILASTIRPEPMPTGRRLVGPTEAVVVLGALVVLYAGFAATQVAVAAGGADRVLSTEGLTYAEYARSGFFQLLWAAGITAVALLALRAATRDGSPGQRRWFWALAVVTALLTEVVVGGALRRIDLYQDVFGLTMLRLSSTVFAWWLGAVFLAVAASFLGVGQGRNWLPSVLAASAVAVLLAWNVATPEAVVVRSNLAAGTDGRFDPDYLADLSDDAVPALAAALATAPPDRQAAIRDAICAGADGRSGGGWASWNRSRSRADEIRTDLC